MTARCNMPAITHTDDGNPRRVGIEIELSGLGYEELVKLCSGLLKGEAKKTGRYQTEVTNTLGTFAIELDSDPIKELDLADESLPEYIREIGLQAMSVIDAAAERIVPLEIVCPPIPFDRVEDIEALGDHLYEAGALGSRESLYYAFGLQLNPELPDFKPSTILRFLRAFAALYEWLKARNQLDLSRKLTTYIEPWDSGYVDVILNPDYDPDLESLMRDYLYYNPTRNRALDLLPLFAHLDAPLLAEYVHDPRVKKRPTFHYRLPDCDIDNPDWHVSSVWNDWVIVEDIAANADHLGALIEAFRESRKLNFHNLTHSWLSTTQEFLKEHGYL